VVGRLRAADAGVGAGPARSRVCATGVLALHGHDGFKYFSKEKVADGPVPSSGLVAELRRELYEGRAFANDLARRGFTVLCPDAFLWGIHRFSPELLHPRGRPEPESLWLGPPPELEPERDAVSYNRAALDHEHLVAKYCTLLGTTLAGVIAYEDRCAVDYLLSRDDLATDRIGCLGLSVRRLPSGAAASHVRRDPRRRCGGHDEHAPAAAGPAGRKPHVDVLPRRAGRARRLRRRGRRRRCWCSTTATTSCSPPRGCATPMHGSPHATRRRARAMRTSGSSTTGGTSSIGRCRSRPSLTSSGG
jgi:hypothetical protein